jgi:hypothetical protein
MGLDVTKLKKNKIVSSILPVLRESAMIVVGILLALQIDSWASDRAETRNLKSNLNYVIEDLNNNKAELQKIKSQKETSIRLCTELIDNYKLNKSMESDDIVITLSGILVTNKFVNNQSGFDRIKTSSLFESNEFFNVRDKIRIYNSVLDDLRFSENFINSYITALSLEMSKQGALLRVFDNIRMKQGIAHYKAVVPNFTISEILNDNKPLQAVLHKYEFDAVALVKNYDKLAQAGDDVQNAIDGYLVE